MGGADKKRQRDWNWFLWAGKSQICRADLQAGDPGKS